jgi:hypothetical protein
MNLFINKSVRKFMLQLVLILVIGIAAFQAVAYTNALRFKNSIITHDYEIVGYLKQAHPELALEIQAAFTAEKSSEDIDAGKALLSQAGYKHSTELFLIPQADSFFKQNIAVNLVLTSLLGFAIICADKRAEFIKVDFAAVALAGSYNITSDKSGIERIHRKIGFRDSH